MKKMIFAMATASLMFAGCGTKKQAPAKEADEVICGFASVELKADLSAYSDSERQMLSLLFDAAEIMDDIFWQEAFPGNKDEFLNSIQNDTLKKFAIINYGPWERLAGNEPFITGYGEKPKGANFYPQDMTAKEFDALKDPNKTSLYTLIRRDEAGKLKVVWYHEAFKEQIEKAASLLEQAAALAEDPGFKNYLTLRAKALRTDDYFESDMAWMDMKNAKFDLVIGPIENYEDALHGYKAAHESFVLLKDLEWSNKLSKFSKLLPVLQTKLPTEEKYKKESPGSDSDINVYEVVLYRGDCNAGSKTIAINLPNDERIHVSKGTRKLQLKNAMKAKFDKILLPISNEVMSEEQRARVKFNAFFENVTFHEVAHGLGIKNTIDGKSTVRKALKETYAPIEEAKADLSGLFLVDQLYQMGEISEGDVNDNYITFFAGVFRSVRFGAASAHGKANMICFNYFMDHQVATKDAQGYYVVDVTKMKTAVAELIAKILKIQGDGDYAAAQKWIAESGVVRPELQKDLDKIANANIPKDIVFKQGRSVMGLK